MPITPATLSDIPVLCELLAELFSQEAEFEPNTAAQIQGLTQIIDHPDLGVILVYRQGQDILGMLNVLYTWSTALGSRVALLEDMLVIPEARAAGIGTQLLQYAIDFAQQQGCKRMTLLTDADNVAAQRFYARQGFSLSSMQVMRLRLD